AQAEPQDDALASPAPKIFRDDCRIDWSRPADQVHNLIRGVSPVPGAFTNYGGKQLKVYRSLRAAWTGAPSAPGTILATEPELVVATGEGALALQEVQMEGRQRMSAKDFVHGHRPMPGVRLGED
ncbi:MAG: methionyl-tRNA formyltransferase, partial [Bacteroidetes bacterium]|nr:methionyl-tRNA formyltransferase [Bacteroidota bacterium]